MRVIIVNYLTFLEKIVMPNKWIELENLFSDIFQKANQRGD